LVSKRPIWLGDAAQSEAALPPTIDRIAGSRGGTATGDAVTAFPG